jgi:hypothetical protein
LILILNIINTDTTYNQYSFVFVVFLMFFCVLVFFCYYASFVRLRRECHIQNLFEQKLQIATILINIGHNLTCFGPVQSFDVLMLKKERLGSHVLRVLSNIEFCARAPGFFIINFPAAIY